MERQSPPKFPPVAWPLHSKRCPITMPSASLIHAPSEQGKELHPRHDPPARCPLPRLTLLPMDEHPDRRWQITGGHVPWRYPHLYPYAPERRPLPVTRRDVPVP